jgi:hypothetical protein
MSSFDYGKKKAKGYADGGAIGYAVGGEVDEMPGIRLGPNANISDDTRSRAMAMVERLNKGKDVDSAPAKKAPVRKAAKPSKVMDTGDETSRLSRRGVKASAASQSPSQSDNSVPTEANRAKDPQPVRRKDSEMSVNERLGRAFKNNKEAVATGVAAASAYPAFRAAKAGTEIVKGVGRRIAERFGARKGADDVMSAANKRAGDSRTARQATPERPPSRDMDEERMAGEGGAFKRGGLVKGRK